MGLLHRDAGKGSDASLHRFGYLSESDPAVALGTGEGGVEAGQCWIEHESGDQDTILDIYLRNEANTGWNSIFNSNTTGSADEITVKSESGAAYTLVLSDAQKMIRLTNGSVAVVTVPPNSSVAFPIGTQVIFEQASTGPVTIQGGAGVTVNSEGGKDDTVGQYAICAIIKVATDTWTLFGNLEAAS